MIEMRIDDTKMQAAFNAIQTGIKDFRPALETSEKYELQEVKRQFESEGVNINKELWHKLAKSTIAARIRAGYGAGPILTMTGRLKKSIQRVKLDANTLQITSKVPYYKYHQTGTRIMPQRQVLGYSETMTRDISQIIAAYLQGLIPL